MCGLREKDRVRRSSFVLQNQKIKEIVETDKNTVMLHAINTTKRMLACAVTLLLFALICASGAHAQVQSSLAVDNTDAIHSDPVPQLTAELTALKQDLKNARGVEARWQVGLEATALAKRAMSALKDEWKAHEEMPFDIELFTARYGSDVDPNTGKPSNWAYGRTLAALRRMHASMASVEADLDVMTAYIEETLALLRHHHGRAFRQWLISAQRTLTGMSRIVHFKIAQWKLGRSTNKAISEMKQFQFNEELVKLKKALEDTIAVLQRATGGAPTATA